LRSAELFFSKDAFLDEKSKGVVKMKEITNKISLTETINIMFPAMKCGLENGFMQTIKFFIYDLVNPVFNDFSPKFFSSESIRLRPNYNKILKLNGYSKGKVYKILDPFNRKDVHEEHMTPNSQFQKKILEYNNSHDFENFIRDNYAIAIITKEENKKLDAGFYKSNRQNLNEAFEIYDKLGIKLKEFKFD